jgi:polyhydroxyalkanoate synthesis regulator phasin
MDDTSRIAKLEAQVDAIKEDVAELKTDVRDLHARITTGNREIMDKLDNKFDSLASSEKSAHVEMMHSVDTLSERVNVLEQWRWMIVGAAIVAGFVLGQIDFKSLFKDKETVSVNEYHPPVENQQSPTKK